MQIVWSRRLTQTAARYGEMAPGATACCNACRTCVTANLLTLATAAVAGGSLASVRLAKRLAGRA
jgi:hypothetical protein